MNSRDRKTPLGRSRKIVTTLGDLIAAAYAAADGTGPERLGRVAVLVTSLPLTCGSRRRLVFTR
jgi:hypothetical protein